MQRKRHLGGIFGPGGQQHPQREIDPRQQRRDDRCHHPHGHARALPTIGQRLTAPVRRQVGGGFRANPAQQFIKVALNELQAGETVCRGTMHALEAQSHARVLQLENRVVDQRVGLEMIENFEKPHTADAFAEETAQHRILRPDMTLFGRNMLHDVVGGRAQNVFCGVGLIFRDPRRSDIGLEEFHRVGDLLHQARKRRAHQGDAQAAEQLQQRPGGAHDRIGIRRHQFVDAEHRRGRLREPRLLRCCRCGYPFFGRGSRGRRRIAGRLR